MSDTTSGGDGSGKDRLKQTAGEARDAARERMEDGKQQTRQAAAQAQERAVEEAERGKERGAGEVRRWSDALESAASELGENSTQGALMRQAAEGLDDIANSIERRSVGEMAEAVADFGRRNPTAFLGSAMLAGFALARFATASRPLPQPAYGRDFDDGYGYDEDYDGGLRGSTRSSGGASARGGSMSGGRPESRSNVASPAVGSEMGPAAASGPAGASSSSHTTSSAQSGHSGGAAPGGLSSTDSASSTTGRKEPLELTEGMRRDEDDDPGGPAHGARPAPGVGSDSKETDR